MNSWSSIISHHKGGITSISQVPLTCIQHERIPPSSTKNSSRPGVMALDNPLHRSLDRTKHVPQLPEVQFVGISTPAFSATSTKNSSSSASATPRRRAPRKKRLSPWIPRLDYSLQIDRRIQSFFQRVHCPVCLLKTRPAFFIHLLNLVAPAPVARMKSSRCSCAWMYPLAARVWSIHSSILIKPPVKSLASTAAAISSADAPGRFQILHHQILDCFSRLLLWLSNTLFSWFHLRIDFYSRAVV